MFPPALLDTGRMGVRLQNIEGIRLIPLIKNPCHMEDTGMEDLHSDLLLGQFPASIVENHHRH
jgi:hypothetical protein